MALDPEHPGANHLYIHLFEASTEPERALPQADRLETLMPKAGHIVHMPSHIYMRLGDYDKAIASNRRSTLADVYFLQTWGDKPFPTIGTFPSSAQSHARHAHDFIRWAATLQGNYATALASAVAAADMPRERWSMGHEQRGRRPGRPAGLYGAAGLDPIDALVLGRRRPEWRPPLQGR